MQYSKLGASGVTVSRLCLGCRSFGSRQWRSWVLEEAEAAPILHRALDLGINFFDTADMYSLGVGEEMVGRILRESASRSRVVIATKVFYPIGPGPNQGGLSRKHIREAAEASLRRLGVDYIDLYMIHRWDPTTPIEETLAAFDDLVRAGKVLYTGASSMAAWQFAKTLYTAGRHGLPRCIAMQNHHNLLYREEEREMLPLCRAEGVGTMPWSPLARGRLARPASGPGTVTARSQSDTRASELYDETALPIVARVQEIAQRGGWSMAAVALAWLLRQEAVCSPAFGVTSIRQLEEAAGAFDVALSDEDCAVLEECYLPRPVRGMDLK